jgi:prepilin-type N-terminal cleavage/methylation domain-containing protein
MLHLLKRKNERGGFTLLELLMVVIIIAILASIALPQYIRATEKARATEAIQILGTLRGAEYRFKALNGTNYTANLNALDADSTVMGDWAAPTATVAGATGFISTKRSAGSFANKVIGIQLGTGTICGDFPPMGVAACVQD